MVNNLIRNPIHWWLPPVSLLGMCVGIQALANDVIVTNSDGEPLNDAVVEVYFERPSATPVEDYVYQRNAAFDPHVITVPTGSHVAFPNEDTTRHHVFSFSPAKTFDLELYLSETPPPIHLDQAGVVVLGCNIHDHMQAFIVVSDAPYAALTNSEGKLTLPTMPEGRHRMRVWHSQMDDSQTIWWEGDISNTENVVAVLELNATPIQPATLSPLQQRFRDATHNH
ncbi:MAG: Cupredoxin [Halomonas sp.]|nr:Cupredoxin [Halomonas sp.]TVP46616.1 MAG: Cupredoxin [Halomonas sp.]